MVNAKMVKVKSAELLWYIYWTD